MNTKEKPKYSVSRLNLYEHCPWAFKTVYLEGIPRAADEARATGQLLHAMVADYLERLIATGQPTDWVWARLATPSDGHPDVVEMWERFYNTFTLPPALVAPGVERQLAFDRKWEPVKFSSRRARFRMVLDFHFRQGSLAVLIDWKTNRTMNGVEKDLQLLAYGWGLKQALYPDVEEVLLRLHFLRYGREREVLLGPDDLKDVPGMLEEKIGRIEKDKHFDPAPGSFCGMCGVTAHCPVMSEALAPVEVLAPATREQAEKAASLLLTLQKMEKELSARLKEWVREYGAVQVGDLVYGPSQMVSYDLTPQNVCTTLLDAGLSREEIWGLLSINKTSLEKGLRKISRQDLFDLALKTGTVRFSERIDFYKTKS
uniref:PD-(D/E)XK endonuclease-like domain-containing protein n=1 Tax=Desulfobacca acetoxidans TaxID=60893 RepID=A0A7V4LCV2_9BACT